MQWASVFIAGDGLTKNRQVLNGMECQNTILQLFTKRNSSDFHILCHIANSGIPSDRDIQSRSYSCLKSQLVARFKNIAQGFF